MYAKPDLRVVLTMDDCWFGLGDRGRYPAKPKVTNFAMNNIRSFAIVATLIAFGALFCIISIGNAEREYESYEKLCSLGATGDDWVSFREFITGRPPIVQLDLPPTIPVDVAMELVTDLHNLESLTVSFDSLTDSQLSTIRNLKLNAIHFNGEFPSDAEIDRLAAFSDVRFLYPVSYTHLTLPTICSV